jgi:hypothetical protein
MKGAKYRRLASSVALAGVAASIMSIGSAGCAHARRAAPATAAAVCEEAVVSPVSGYAECVRPRGAPVAPPPPRPDHECSALANDTAQARHCAAVPETQR